MSYIGKGLLSLLKFIPRYTRFLPAGLSGLFVVLTFIIDWYQKGFSFAIAHISTIFLAAELTINKAVHLAIQDSPEYTFLAFLGIVSSVIILVMFIRFLTKLMVKITGSQAEWGAALMSSAFVFALEIATVRFSEGTWGFIPFKDGIWFLIVNLGPVLSNIHFF